MKIVGIGRHGILRFAAIALTMAAVAISFVNPPFPEPLILQHIPTALALVLLVIATTKFRVSTGSFACCIAFLWLHIIGARWIYSFVPYDRWSEAAFGQSISETFGWQRNHYDRLVHFASGTLGLPIAAEAIRVHAGVDRRWALAFLGICIVLAIGAVYEILEWQIAVTLSPSAAEAYNGQQGDPWDPQKDLMMAMLGSIVCLPIFWLTTKPRSSATV